MENLMLNIIDEFLEIEEDQKEVWKVKNDVDADWCLDKITEYKAEYNRFEMVAKAKMQQIEMSLKKEKKKMDNDISFFESKLREYFETIKDIAKDSKTQKVYKLPSGSLRIKKEQMVIDYDKSKLLGYAEQFEDGEMDEYIKTTKEFKWADFKKILSIENGTLVDKETGELVEVDYIMNKETGEIVEIEGLEIKTKPEEFIVEV